MADQPAPYDPANAPEVVAHVVLHLVCTDGDAAQPHRERSLRKVWYQRESDGGEYVGRVTHRGASGNARPAFVEGDPARDRDEERNDLDYQRHLREDLGLDVATADTLRLLADCPNCPTRIVLNERTALDLCRPLAIDGERVRYKVDVSTGAKVRKQ